MDINQHLIDLKKIGEQYKLMFFSKTEKTEITSIEDLLNSRFKNSIHHRFSGDLTTNMGISLVCQEGIIFNMELSEFYPCCGKAIGKKLYVKQNFYGKGEIHITDNILNQLFTIYMNIIEQILKHCKYSSFSFIVSKPEQPVFYKLINEIKTYKVINEFKNERMSSKHLCLEFCKNLW